MSIVNIDPPDWQSANVIQVDSSAPTNSAALREIDSWGSERRFVALPTFNLRRMLRNGRAVFRAVCYRITDEDLRSIDALNRRQVERLARLPIRVRTADENGDTG